MRITELLDKRGIDLDAKPQSKSEAIDQLVDLMNNTGNLTNQEEYKKCVLAREEEGTTGIGEGVAIPHAKTTAVARAGLSVIVAKDGVDYDSLDGAPAYLLFLIAAPNTKENVHLDVLGRLSILLMDDDFRQKLIHAASKDEFLKLIDEAETVKFADEKKEKPQGLYRLLAVTSCPTGIAHTYMAAESIERKAKEMGISIKVEKDGADGIKDALTKEEIEHAECIIVAADREVEMTRFDGKKVIQTKVSNGISKAQNLIQQAIEGNVLVYHSSVKGNSANTGEDESAGRKIYKHLMNGVSHMLPFVIGGGILIALSFLFDNYAINPAKFGTNTPFAAFLNKVGGTAFNFMMPILAGYIAMSIGDRPALAVGFVGGALAAAGGSSFFGALFAGFLAGYLIVGLRKLFSKIPSSLEGIKPVLFYPFLGVLIIGVLMIFVVNPPLSAFNQWITSSLNAMGNTSKILLGLLLGAMMSIDFGGPINKAAYLFGTASIATGNLNIMAAVMIGGMVPPLAIALCTTFFRNRFTLYERQSGITNYILGLSFITEGAIPFAASDPLRVIPACAIGSATAGALSMLFNCTLRAPHGGVFVFALVGNAVMYVVALLIGSVVGALLLAVLKKPIEDKDR
ncbi:MAG TPA: fructose-specific PTS transporter subunit EIIC [Oscillospiraceae bacterium]|nr:fructose-specific PTS transporter subunit EIIC [Oscillospiraceae bacterium]